MRHFRFHCSVILRLAAVLLSGASRVAAQSPGEPSVLPLPDWAKPIESILPKLPPELISEVDDLCEFVDNNYESGNPTVNAQLDSTYKRLVELQEKAGLAMIWRYLKLTDNRSSNYQLLTGLRDDRDLAAWLLPIIRFRMEWLKHAPLDSQLKEYFDREQHHPYGELYQIQTYLYRQGEFSDIETLNMIADKAKRMGIDLGFEWGTSTPKRLAEQVKAMQEAREASAYRYEPRTSPQTPEEGGYRPEPLGPRKPLPEIKLPTPFLQPWMVWPMWICIGLVSLGLLRWAFRRAKDA
jgi:hypothetical protein